VRLLNTHPHLSGFPGEANELWHPALEPFERTRLPTPPIEADPERFSQVSLANWPPDHGERLRDIFAGFHLLTGPSKTFFTKSAMISFMIPTILEIFPDARIVHIYRFGPAVVKSYVKKNLGKYSRFAYAESDYRMMCARYWNACILEIAEKARTLPRDQFLEFSYEELCQNPRGVMERVGAFVGIASTGFTFDTSELSDQNFKAREDRGDPADAQLLALMSPGLTLKGYAAATSASPSRPS
jgi:hypothetical protein